MQELLLLYEKEKEKNELKTRRIRMLEKLIIELGGVVPQDKLGLGDESSRSLIKGSSPSPAKQSDLTENSGTGHGAQKMATNTENDGAANMEAGVGAGVL